VVADYCSVSCSAAKKEGIKIMMKVAVTGGCGHIGTYLIPMLGMWTHYE
jgi:hypothetical protein